MRFKKLAAGILAAGMMLSSAFTPSLGALTELFTVKASAVITGTAGNFKYKIINGKASITDYTGDAPYITVPSTITTVADTYPVTSIDNYALRGLKNAIAIEIPDGVTFIGMYAFSSCPLLEKVVLPDSVYCISAYAFSYCDSLETITLPDSVTTIYDYAFKSCKKLKSFTYPKGAVETGIGAFMDCTALESVTLHDGIEMISLSTFSGCSKLESIVIPSGVKNIMSASFYNCTSLKSIVIPENVEQIYPNSFKGCTSLQTVEILPREKKLSIGTSEGSVFEGCTSLTEVKGSIYASYSTGTFKNCTSLTEFEFASDIGNISSYMFSGCTSLKSITIPFDSKHMNDYVFENCTNLEKVVIPNRETTISAHVFSGCKNLTIYGVAGSNAETHAKENNIPFVAIEAPVPSLSGKVTNVGAATQGIRLTLTDSDGNKTNIPTKSGNVFEIYGLADGNYKFTVEQSLVAVPREYNITISGGTYGKELNVTLINYGDIDCDSYVTIKDALQIVNYRNSKASSFDSVSGNDLAYLIKVADINKDGKVNINDALQIVNYRNGKASAFDDLW